MKKMLYMLMLLLCTCAVASAQEYVSVSELHEQAEAMGGWWQETFSTPNGEMTVDAPIIVPDIEQLPVLTLERAKISGELFDQIAQGKKTSRREADHQYELELDGKLMEFYLGRDNYSIYGQKTNYTGYDAVRTLWIQHGEYRFSQGTGQMKAAEPNTYHYPWEIDMDTAYMRGSDQTIDDMMRVWQEDIESCLGEGYDIRPKWIEIEGSVLVENTGKDAAYKRDGHARVYAEQYIGDVPVFGGIATITSTRCIPHTATKESNRTREQLRGYQIGAENCGENLTIESSNDENYRTMTELAKTRTVEFEDVPLASLDAVLDGIAKEIEAGHIRVVTSVRLGYLLYSNPEMTDYAWAVPSWVVECKYVPKATEKYEDVWTKEGEIYTGETAPWSGQKAVELSVDAQTGEPIIFTVGDEETFSVPVIVTWDDV